MWKPIVGYEGCYEVSNLGRVKMLKRYGVPETRIKGLYLNTNKYLMTHLKLRGVRKTRTVHSLVLESFIGPRPSGLEIDHLNAIKTDNRLENLEYVTGAENIRRAQEMGLIPKAKPKVKVSTRKGYRLTEDGQYVKKKTGRYTRDPNFLAKRHLNTKGYQKTKAGNYSVRISINGKYKSLGTFNNDWDAMNAYEKARNNFYDLTIGIPTT